MMIEKSLSTAMRVRYFQWNIKLWSINMQPYVAAGFSLVVFSIGNDGSYGGGEGSVFVRSQTEAAFETDELTENNKKPTRRT